MMSIVYLLIIAVFIAFAVLVLYCLYSVIRIIGNIIWSICGAKDRDEHSLSPTKKSAKEQIEETWAKSGYTSGGGFEAHTSGAVKVIDGWDGTYEISGGATMRIEHRARNGERKVYYSVSDIQDSGDRQLIEQYLEEED